MQKIPVSLSILILLCTAQTRADNAPSTSKEDQAVILMRQLQPLIGTFDAKGQGFDAQGKVAIRDQGTVRSGFQAQGHVMVMTKEFKRTDGSTFEDLMVFYYDGGDRKIHAMLYSLADNPRKIDVTVEPSQFVLNYAPLEIEGRTMITRETITPGPDGSLHWLIDHQRPDGTYEKHREIDASLKK